MTSNIIFLNQGFNNWWKRRKALYVAILNEAKKMIAEGDDDPKNGGLASCSVLIVVCQNTVR